ncbi:unnamed protein product, partial [Mesorhabditis spiculigera]
MWRSEDWEWVFVPFHTPRELLIPLGALLLCLLAVGI